MYSQEDTSYLEVTLCICIGIYIVLLINVINHVSQAT